jgi:hypothetical protein
MALSLPANVKPTSKFYLCLPFLQTICMINESGGPANRLFSHALPALLVNQISFNRQNSNRAKEEATTRCDMMDILCRLGCRLNKTISPS